MMGKARWARGQSLVEMILVTPLVLLIFVIAGFIGVGMYQAHMASNAIRQPAMKKMEMANTTATVDSNQLLGYVTGGPQKGTIKTGAAVDSITVRSNGFQNEAAVIVGTKQYQVVSWLPTFNFTVAQAIPSKLLEPAHFGARVRTGPWVPGGTPRTPPYMNPVTRNLPPGFDPNPNCQRIPVSPAALQSVDTEGTNLKTYLAVPDMPPLPPSPIKEDALVAMALTMPGCDSDGGVCQREFDDFLPDPRNGIPEEDKSISGTGTRAGAGRIDANYTMKNPPGAPGMELTYSVFCVDSNSSCMRSTSAPRYTPLPEIGPSHGRYFDPTGQWKQPPPEFIGSCKARKKAECQLRAAIDKANSIASAYQDDCNGR